MKWSENLPDACPPNDACECESIAVYRFLNDNKDTSRNFLTVRELQPKRTFPELEKECRACSLSVFTDKDEVIKLQSVVPRWRKPVAILKLDKTSGKIKHTPSPNTDNSHHSWWVPVDLNPETLSQKIIQPPASQ
jgi:hypothetical protein